MSPILTVMAVDVAALPTRERLARTALHLFAERGYDGVSNREIVEACGLTKGAIYWYYESKEDLFRSSLSEALLEWQERVMEAIQGSPGWRESLAALFRLFIATLGDHDDPHRDLLILLTRRLPQGPGQSDLARPAQARLLAWIEHVLEGADHAHDLAQLVQATGLGVLVQAAAGHDVAEPVLSHLLRVVAGTTLELGSPSSPR